MINMADDSNIFHPKSRTFFTLTVFLLLFAIIYVLFYQKVQWSSKEYAGIYNDGFESSTFLHCGSAKYSWASGVQPPSPELLRGIPGEYTIPPFYVVIKGTLFENGHFGHLGMWSSKIDIEKVLETSATIPSGCDLRGKHP